ncbi:ABC transporter ATP-binding protein [Chthonobacter albigriseus]|uniref:ABC transporter ATP-binding protein n=1 Tax=Chthonobacter albigriseus TaxID=1683161 RepID=UPI0015EF0ACA|nr:ABC transporter ATP-binding protein [Chthonobacter albigriseus]
MLVKTPVGTEALVAFERVTKSYDGATLVVKALDLTVRRGEFLTLLGPSGSGKTTTLMMLAGFERPTSGHILLDGAPVEKLPPEKRNIGVVFQNYALFPHMSVEENIAFPLRYHGVTGPAAKEKVDKVLGMIHLEGFGGRRPTQLSGGQQQRVALARALVFQPKLVLMDEPLGALDKQLRERMQVEIKHIQRSLGVTIVFVTHDQSEALTMSDRIAVFSDGMVQQLAGPTELYERPANRFVAQFIGENNVLPGDVSTDGRALRLAGGAVVLLPAAIAPGAVEATVRPERLQAADRASDRAIRFPATVREVFFLGDHARLTCEGLGVAELSVKMAAAEFSVLQPAAGSSLTLAFEPEAIHVLAR